jgi:hypothetical protein
VIADRHGKREADAILSDLTAGGYRILAPGELDAATIEACASECDRLDDVNGMEAGLAAACATALRTLGASNG